jgi:hypothetical protein
MFMTHEKSIATHMVWLVVFLSVLSIMFVSIPKVALSFSGAEMGEKLKDGTVSTVKGSGNAIVWTGKGVYRFLEYLVEEVVRPVRPLTDKMVDIFGVTTTTEA